MPLLEVLDALAEVEPELAPPPPDQSPSSAFDIEMCRSFLPSLLGDNIANQRVANVKRQMERLEDADYIAQAKRDYQIMEDKLHLDIKAADDAMGDGRTTGLLTQTCASQSSPQKSSY